MMSSSSSPLSLCVVLLLLSSPGHGHLTELSYPLGSCEPLPPPVETVTPEQFCKRGPIVGKVTMRTGSGCGSALIGLMQGFQVSIATNVCFYIDEETSLLRSPNETSFVFKYFHLYGPFLLDAKTHRDSLALELSYPRERVLGQIHLQPVEFPSMNVSGVRRSFKASFVQNLIRFRYEVGDSLCQKFEAFKLPKDYITMSFRRGDKTLEGHTPIPVQKYIDYVHSKGIIGVNEHATVFVATDDYAVIPELQALRPNWRLVSASAATDKGFMLSDWRRISPEDRHRNLMKFFLELHGMANAKVFVGTVSSNVAFLGYYVRWRHPDDTYHLVDAVYAIAARHVP